MIFPLPIMQRPATRPPLVERELSLAEMLADPIVQMLMCRDRVQPEAIEALFASLRYRRAA